MRGRGAPENPPNRFERLHYAEDPEPGGGVREAEPGVRARGPATRFYRDPSRRLIAFNTSPDVPFDASLNPYRGCEHGCIYCFARPSHEYLGLSSGLDFETRILVKEDAPTLLARELAAPGWKPRVVGLGAVTDAYQPVERRLRLTRRCLEVFLEFRNPVTIVTKNGLVARDADVLSELAGFEASAVFVSLTTLDRALHRIMEPRTSTPANRLAAIESLAGAGVPVGAMLAPLIPGLNDHEIPALVQAARDAGAGFLGHMMLRLPGSVAGLFERWLERHVPERRQKVLNRVRSMRGGALNDPRFHVRMRGEGFFADQVHALFDHAARRAGLANRRPRLSTQSFRRPEEPQLSLFVDA